MTRKCALCKETNYKNTYSFFSAPKDPETRKKWQDAIGIENYSVSDDTYVCSKHFHRNDIITHWVSGVPPHIITIKYKKCRLRPGAVPNRNVHDTLTIQNLDKYSDLDEFNTNNLPNNQNDLLECSESQKETFLIPREESTTNGHSVDSDKDVKNYRIEVENEEYVYMHGEHSQSNKNTGFVLLQDNERKESEIPDESESEDHCIEDVVYENVEETQDTSGTQKCDSAQVYNVFCDETAIYLPDMDDPLGDGGNALTETQNHTKVEKCTVFKRQGEFRNIPNSLDDSFNEKRTLQDVNDDDNVSMCRQLNRDEMLFEDLLEVCTEAALPYGWSCMVTSKGHTTTVLYVFMSITKTGIPFIEKQVFINSDMVLRCAATNREINLFHHNLLKDSKRIKVRTLMDVEELIDEFDQRIICEGVFNIEGIHEIHVPRIAYNDGIKLRHVSCPLILNNDTSRCSKCIALSHIVTKKSRRFTYLPPDCNTLSSKRQKEHSWSQRMVKRARECDRRYEFVKKLKT